MRAIVGNPAAKRGVGSASSSAHKPESADAAASAALASASSEAPAPAGTSVRTGPSVSSAGGSAGGGANTKPHPQVERNRRDALNQLIDQLRELVPASFMSPVTHYVRGNDRRPKHAVLRETIDTIRHLRQVEASTAAQVQQLQARVQQLELQLAHTGQHP
ncbi:hypothetical protein V8C86DRAFT_2643654 [Haematococcus lacustris]